MAEEIKKKTRVINYFESPVLFKVPEGKKFVKEVLYEGTFRHPSDPYKELTMDVARFTEWVNNFRKKVIDIVYVPLNHSDNPKDNTGFVEDLYIGESESHPGRKALFAKFNIVLTDIADKIGKTIVGCSIGAERYFSPEGEDMGECLGHIALTNEPYIPHLGEFVQVAFSKQSDITVNNYVFEREKRKDNPMEDTKMADEKELVAMKEKIAELEKANKEAQEKVELARKESELYAKKSAEMEKINFEREMASEIEKLVLSKKVLPANKEEVLNFAKSIGKENAYKYFKTLGLNADVVDTSVVTKDGGKPAQKTNLEKPDVKDLDNVFKAWLTRKIDTKTALSKCEDFKQAVELSKGMVDTREVIQFKRNADWK